MRVLVVNVGSSSVKLRLLDEDDSSLFSEDLPVSGLGLDPGSMASAISSVEGEVDAVGHRVVHGGTRFTGPVVLDTAVEDDLRALSVLAPLHQAKSLAGIDTVSNLFGGVPAVACFDTAFHATMPDVSSTYAIPAEWRDDFGVRRYGFHGLSHAYASTRAAELLDRRADELRIVTCHLGAGASLCAVRNGASVDTTMGFTPLEGLVMATRSGTVDPSLVDWLVQRKGFTTGEVVDALENSSGLLALAGTADMKEVEFRARNGEPSCVLALGLYVHRLRAGIAAMASAMGGLDALVFTGGVGEHSATVRADAVGALTFFGVGVDEHANQSARGDVEITAPDATVRTLVVEAREDLQIAGEVRKLLRR